MLSLYLGRLQFQFFGHRVVCTVIPGTFSTQTAVWLKAVPGFCQLNVNGGWTPSPTFTCSAALACGAKQGFFPFHHWRLQLGMQKTDTSFEVFRSAATSGPNKSSGKCQSWLLWAVMWWGVFLWALLWCQCHVAVGAGHSPRGSTN